MYGLNLRRNQWEKSSTFANEHFNKGRRAILNLIAAQNHVNISRQYTQLSWRYKWTFLYSPLRVYYRKASRSRWQCGHIASQPPVSQRLPIHEFSRSHNDAPLSVAILRTSDQLVAETSTCQHTTLTADI